MHKALRYFTPVAAGSLALFFAHSTTVASDLDDRIESAARKSHVFKTYLKDDSIRAESKDGVVTLSGTVSESSHKSLAEDTVEGLPGVRSVDNQLRVRHESPAEHSDSWLSTKVRTTLLFHRNVSISKTDVSAKDGVISLRGEASSQAQKELTGEYASDVEGVKEVRNDIKVVNSSTKPGTTLGEKIDDASITAQVKMSLASHRSTSALKTKITTNDGAVTISGVAKNDAEKSLVTKLVNDITGVTSVVNNMTVAVPVAAN